MEFSDDVVRDVCVVRGIKVADDVVRYVLDALPAVTLAATNIVESYPMILYVMKK